MKITENELFDYIFCPAKYKLKYIDNINFNKHETLSSLLKQVSLYFYANLLDNKVPSFNMIKSKWDSICESNKSNLSNKQVIEGWGKILTFLKWAEDNKIMPVDITSKYSILADDVELLGTLNPIFINTDRKFYINDLSFSNKALNQMQIDTNTKYTIDSFAFRSVYKQDLSAIKVHSIKYNKDYFSNRNKQDYKALKQTIISVAKGIKNNIFYPRRQFMCDTCPYCRICRYWTS